MLSKEEQKIEVEKQINGIANDIVNSMTNVDNHESIKIKLIDMLTMVCKMYHIAHS